MSAYAKLPDGTPENDPSPGARAERIARSVAKSVDRGLGQATKALAAPSGADVAALIAEANLPEVSTEDPLPSLARRLDREADLWRNLALRELAHVAWANRIAHLASMLTILGVAALAGFAAFGSLFGGSAGRALMICAGALVLGVGAAVATLASSSVRKGQREVVRDAFARADLAELRLHRIAVTMASLKNDPDNATEAIARLEKDATG